MIADKGTTEIVHPMAIWYTERMSGCLMFGHPSIRQMDAASNFAEAYRNRRKIFNNIHSTDTQAFDGWMSPAALPRHIETGVKSLIIFTAPITLKKFHRISMFLQ